MVGNITKKTRLDKLNKRFPVELNTTNTSNIYQTNKVFSRELINLEHNRYLTNNIKRLNRPIRIWKTQDTPNEYTINCIIQIPNLKSVTITPTNETLEYVDENITSKLPHIETFSEVDQTGYYEYTSPVIKTPELIPSTLFKVTVETYDELRIVKGYPEISSNTLNSLKIEKERITDTGYDLNFNTSLTGIKTVLIRSVNTETGEETSIINNTYDTPINTYNYTHSIKEDNNLEYEFIVQTNDYGTYYNSYDNNSSNINPYTHDSSLDIIGALLNVPRRRYINKYDYTSLNDYYKHVDPSSTEPTYYNQVDESDYDYENRIRYYITNYSTGYLPCLELFKRLSTESDLVNRKEILIRQDIDNMWEEGCLDYDDELEKQDTLISFMNDTDATIMEEKIVKLKISTTENTPVIDGTIHVLIDGTSYNIQVNNGYATKKVTFSTPGEYPVTAIYNGTTEYNSSTKINQTLIVHKRQPTLKGLTVTGKPGATIELQANITYPNHYINNKKIIVDEGIINFSINGKVVGYGSVSSGVVKTNYTIPVNASTVNTIVKASYNGTDLYEACTDYFNIIIRPNKIGTRLQSFTVPCNIVGALLYDKTGKALTGKALKVQINGITADTITSDSTRICYTSKLNYIKQVIDPDTEEITTAGDVVTLVYDGDEFYESCNVQVYPPLNTQEKKVRDVYFKYAYVYPGIVICKVYDEYNKPVTTGKLYFNKNGSTVSGGEQKVTSTGYNKIQFTGYSQTDVLTISYSGVTNKYNPHLVTIDTSVDLLLTPTLTFGFYDSTGTAITDIDAGTKIYLKGKLTYNTTPLKNQPLEVWIGDHLAINKTADVNATTDNNGEYSIPYTPTKSGLLSITLKYPGNDKYKAVTVTNSLSVVTVKLNTSITPVSKTSTSFTFGLYDSNGLIVNGKTVNATVNDEVLDTIVTDGANTVITLPTNPASDIVLKFDGDDDYNSCLFNVSQWNPGSVPEQETDIDPIITVTSTNPSFYVGMNLDLHAQILIPNMNPGEDYVKGSGLHLTLTENGVIVLSGVTDTNGELIFKKANLTAGTYSYKATSKAYGHIQTGTSTDYTFTLLPDSETIQDTKTSLTSNVNGTVIHVGDTVKLSSSTVGTSGAVNSGDVKFYKEIDGTPTLLGTVTVNSKGVAEYSFTQTKTDATVNKQHFYTVYVGTTQYRTSTSQNSTGNYYYTRIATTTSIGMYNGESSNILTGQTAHITGTVHNAPDSEVTNNIIQVSDNGTHILDIGWSESVSGSYNYSTTSAGTHIIHAKWTGDGIYEASEASMIITASSGKATSNITINTTTIYYGENITANLTANGNSLSGATLTFNVNNRTLSATTDSNGNASVTTAGIPDMGQGDYTISVNYEGNEAVNPKSTSKTISVKKHSTSVNILQTSINRWDNLQVQLLGDHGEYLGAQVINYNITFKTGFKSYAVTTSGGDGIANLTIGAEAQTLSVRAVYGGNQYYNGNEDTKSVVVADSCSLNFTSKTVVYKEPLAVRLTSNGDGTGVSGKSITLNLGNSDGNKNYYLTTDSNGYASLNVTTNPSKGLTANATFGGDSNYNSATTGTQSIDYQRRDSAVYTNINSLKVGGTLNGILYDLCDQTIDGKALSNCTRLNNLNMPVTLTSKVTGAGKTYDSSLAPNSSYNTYTNEFGQSWIKVNIVGQLTYQYVFGGNDYYKGSSSSVIDLNVTN